MYNTETIAIWNMARNGLKIYVCGCYVRRQNRHLPFFHHHIKIMRTTLSLIFLTAICFMGADGGGQRECNHVFHQIYTQTGIFFGSIARPITKQYFFPIDIEYKREPTTAHFNIHLSIDNDFIEIINASLTCLFSKLVTFINDDGKYLTFSCNKFMWL